ncbi:YggT family protein [Demetria terragena]|uniref:YggT family protein n=1 Tax=Demetria terragena TaxID=63959 RepID=UPI000475AB6B|nr:YggT family protein [Demetria terragena]
MEAVRALLALLLYLFLILLIARLVLEWVQVLARDWQPRGVVLVVAEVVYTATDPPLKALRRVIPPLRIGQISLDLGFLILMLAVTLTLGLLT